MTLRRLWGSRAVRVPLLACLLFGSGVLVTRAATPVATFTGCLTPGGTLTLVAAGDTPLKPCTAAGGTQITLGGGDITSILTPKGSGLTGGGTNGDVTLGLDPAYQLPQSCTTGQLPSWNDATKTWGCATDQNTTYGAGTGLDLNSNTFSVEPGYRLPQSCAAGQVAKANASGTWVCAADQVGSSTLPGVFYTSYPDLTNFGFLPGDGQFHPVLQLVVPPSNYLVHAPVQVDAQDTDAAVVCVLRVGGTQVHASEVEVESPGAGTMVLVAPASLPSGGAILVECNASPDNRGVTVRSAIAALQVGTIQILPRQ